MLQVILYVVYGLLLGMAIIGATRLRYAIKHFAMKSMVTGAKMIEDIPSVTVCIPARNEYHTLADCLDQVIASNYPKLEVIVLDDMSGDKTSSLIKAYAHEGVRFVEGEKLPSGWLGKNHALQALLEEASGTYILYIDVDTRLAPDAIEQLVAYAQQEKATMVSVLPRREGRITAGTLFSTLRYFWEIMFHSSVTPATASSAWLIHRQTLLDRWKGFSSFKDAIQPESRFSADLMASGQYRFLIGTMQLGVSYVKDWRSQLSTSVRLLFPLLQMKIPYAIIAVLDLLIIISPLWIITAGFFVGWGIHQLFAILIMCMFAAIYGMYLKRIWNTGWLTAALVWPVVVLQELLLIIVSVIGYTRKLVTWKGRLVKTPK